MDKVMAIFKKELKGIVLNPTFFVVCGLCTIVMSWVYSIQLSLFIQELANYVYQSQVPKQQLNIHYAIFLRHLSYLNLMLILVVPAITMRLFSEEKKMRTFDLLLTAPVTSAQIVIGKYLAVMVSILILVFLAFLYPAMTAIFTKINWAILIIAFFGIFLVSAVYAGMNLFCSALTESAIVSYVMAVIANLAIWFVSVGGEVVDSSIGRKIFEHTSMSVHLSSLVEGTIRSGTLVFFATLIFLFGFLSERVVESTRWR